MSNPLKSDEASDRLSRLIDVYGPALAPKKSPWRAPAEAREFVVTDAVEIVPGMLAYLDVTNKDHDGYETYRRVHYNITEKVFICDRTRAVMKNVQGWMMLEGER